MSAKKLSLAFAGLATLAACSTPTPDAESALAITHIMDNSIAFACATEHGSAMVTGKAPLFSIQNSAYTLIIKQDETPLLTQHLQRDARFVHSPTTYNQHAAAHFSQTQQTAHHFCLTGEINTNAPHIEMSAWTGARETLYTCQAENGDKIHLTSPANDAIGLYINENPHATIQGAGAPTIASLKPTVQQMCKQNAIDSAQLLRLFNPAP